MLRKILLSLLLVLFLVGGTFAVYNIYSIVSEYREGEQLYSSVQQHIALPAAPEKTEDAETAPSDPVPEPSQTPEEPAETKPEITYPEVDFDALQQISGDVVGWIYLEDTNINYPIVQGYDNRHYVSTLIDGTPNGSGSIFMDYRNGPDFSDVHTVLYGHNMKNGTMFHDILNYREQEYYDAHPIGLILTPEKNYYFEILSVYVASLADSAWQLEFVDDADAHQWLQAAADRSAFVSRVQPQPGDRVITLSTCSYEFEEARFVLVGILKEG